MEDNKTGDPPKRQGRNRRPKSGNSEAFNSVLSAANALSVNERVRLCKSIAGQHGLVVLSVQQAANLTKGGVDANRGQEATNGGQPKHVNPLKDTVFQRNLDSAKAKLRAEKERRQVAELPADDLVRKEYLDALKAYKDERIRLGIQPAQQERPTNGGKTSKRVRTASKSPEVATKAATQTATTVLSRVFSRSSRSKNKDGEEDMETL